MMNVEEAVRPIRTTLLTYLVSATYFPPHSVPVFTVLDVSSFPTRVVLTVIVL
jgi:hypothetical protein